MPWAPRKPCPGCGILVERGSCPACTRARQRDVDARRPSAAKRLYDSAWQQARAAFLARHPVCNECPRPATIVDHDPPHRGDRAAFWDRRRWRPKCKTCHDRKTAREDGGFGNRRQIVARPG